MPGTLKLNSGGAGNLILTPSGSVGSDVTVTVPAVTGTAMVSANMPAFSAYYNGSLQSISANTWTKIILNAEDFDTASCFDSTTNYRFTPNVAGYYQINLVISSDISGSSNAWISGAIYKNGSVFKGSAYYGYPGAPAEVSIPLVVYFNGSRNELSTCDCAAK